MSASLTKSFADVTRRKSRALLVILGIFIGVCGLTAITLTEDTLVSAFAFTSGYHAIRPDIVLDVDRLDPALLPALAATANVQTVQYQSVYPTQWEVPHAIHPSTLLITSYPDLQHVPLTPFQLTAGRDPGTPGAGEIAMEAGDQSLAPFAVGNLVTVDTPGGPVALRVVGLARTPGANPASSGAALAYMSDAGLAQLVGPTTAGSPGKPAPYRHEIAVKLHATAQARVNDTAAALQRGLASDGITVLNTTLATANLDTGTLAAIEGIFTLLLVLAGVAVTLSGLLILNTITALVAEQTSIIGTMKALGATRGVIVRGYLVTVGLDSLVATLPGLALGLYAGWALSSALAPQIPLALGPFAVAPWVVALGLLAGCGVPLVAALIPLGLGTRITVREAIAAYGVNAGQGAGDGLLARLGAHVGWVSQVTWLGLRDTFRKRWRAALTLVTLTLAAASFLVVQTASASVNATIGAVRANASSDLSVNFNDLTTYAQLRDQLAALPNVAAIERSGGGNVTTAWGILQVSAWEPDTHLYHPHLTSGRWLQPGDTNVILLSDDAARKSGLRAGDTVTVRNNYRAHTQMTLTIIGTVHQTIDVIGWIGAAIVPVNTMYALDGIPAAQAASGTQEIDIAARDNSLAAVNRLAAAVNQIVNPDGSSYDGVGYYNGARGSVDTTHEYVTRRQGDGYLLYILLYAVALIVGVVGVLGLANALVASVLERRREIGLLRALGATGRRVARVFWVEALALSLMAWCGGALVGLPLAYAFVQVFARQVMPVDFSADPLAFAVMLAAVLVIATLASVVPSWRAARQRTVDLLRYE
ncbi:MAG TPA: FtsX-like permease family protein [Ktedonobacterales bacterium]|jgi:ABC-type antimicrobial peptide transport system permease subunit